jgi:uncharacterized protein (TIGR01777 family)
MKILITGGSGFIGQALTRQLSDAGHEVTILDRNSPRHVPDGVRLILMDLLEDDVRSDVVADQDAVIHLMGVNVFSPWTKRRKQAIYASRVITGRKLAGAIMDIHGNKRPKVYVTASAVGYYGNAAAPVSEQDGPGDDYLAKLCVEWEAVTDAFAGSNVRTAIIRSGIVIGRGGLVSMLKKFYKAYAGAVVGSGTQLISWIALPDLLNIYQRAVEDERWTGAVNAVAPEPVTFDSLTKLMAEKLKRPRWLKLPAVAMKPVYRGLADTMTYSQHVVPGRLKSFRYSYVCSDIAGALDLALGTAPQADEIPSGETQYSTPVEEPFGDVPVVKAPTAKPLSDESGDPETSGQN